MRWAPALAVIPSEGKAYAPITGTLVTVMPHAFGIKADNGLEVLVHVGLDTVELGRQASRRRSSRVTGSLPASCSTEFDIAGIKAAGFNPMTVLIVTNRGAASAVVPVAEGQVRPQELVLDLVG